MGKLVGILGAGIGLAVEVARSNKAQPTNQSHDSPDHHALSPNSAQATSRSPRPKSYDGYSGGDYEAFHEDSPHAPSSPTPSRRLEKHTEHNDSEFRKSYHDEETTSNWWEVEGNREKEDRKSGEGRDIFTNDEKSRGAYADEPPSYTVATRSGKSSPHSRLSSERGFDENAPKSPIPRGALELPVIVPQRRPEDKSRGWMLCYAPMLESCDISQTEFMEFLTSFNKSSQVRTIPVTKSKIPLQKLTVFLIVVTILGRCQRRSLWRWVCARYRSFDSVNGGSYGCQIRESCSDQ